VLAGQSRGALRPLASVRKTSFETRIAVPGSAGSFAVRALGPGGHVLATSAVVPAR